jgi:hypothetical protein
MLHIIVFAIIIWFCCKDGSIWKLAGWTVGITLVLFATFKFAGLLP